MTEFSQELIEEAAEELYRVVLSRGGSADFFNLIDNLENVQFLRRSSLLYAEAGSLLISRGIARGEYRGVNTWIILEG